MTPTGTRDDKAADHAIDPLEGIIASLRSLAVDALDAGYPLAAAQIASSADRLEADAFRRLPPRPRYDKR